MEDGGLVFAALPKDRTALVGEEADRLRFLERTRKPDMQVHDELAIERLRQESRDRKRPVSAYPFGHLCYALFAGEEAKGANAPKAPYGVIGPQLDGIPKTVSFGEHCRFERCSWVMSFEGKG
jgi:hypothetical protein